MSAKSNWIRNRRTIQVILTTTVFATIVRLLISFEIDKTALLYLAVPYLIALTLAFTRRKTNVDSIPTKYTKLVVDSLIVMLASSLVLFEGFICVLMFMPIYFFVIFIGFLIESLTFKYSKKHSKNKFKAHLLPVVLLVFTIEGITPDLSYPRNNIVVVNKVVNQSPEQIIENLKRPIELNVERHWFLDIFPMPYHIDAETLNSGDIHTIDYRYHRWFFTNTHEGTAKLLIEHADSNFIKTRILEDNSYISNYIDLYGTEIQFTPIANGMTNIKLSISYTRKLDPAWYYAPLQTFGITKMGEFLIDEMMAD